MSYVFGLTPLPWIALPVPDRAQPELATSSRHLVAASFSPVAKKRAIFTACSRTRATISRILPIASMVARSVLGFLACEVSFVISVASILLNLCKIFLYLVY